MLHKLLSQHILHKNDPLRPQSNRACSETENLLCGCGIAESMWCYSQRPQWCPSLILPNLVGKSLWQCSLVRVQIQQIPSNRDMHPASLDCCCCPNTGSHIGPGFHMSKHTGCRWVATSSHWKKNKAPTLQAPSSIPWAPIIKPTGSLVLACTWKLGAEPLRNKMALVYDTKV